MKKIIIIAISIILISGCNIINRVDLKDWDWMVQSQARQTIQDLAWLIDLGNQDIYKAKFDWRKEDNYETIKVIEIDGYQVKNPNFIDHPGVEFDEAFKDRDISIYNVADGPGQTMIWYSSWEIVCLININTNASIEEIYEWELYADDFTYSVVLSCGEDWAEQKAQNIEDSNDSNFIFIAEWEEPFWDYVLKDGVLVFYGSALEEKVNYSVNLIKDWDDYFFYGDWIEGQIIKEDCIDSYMGYSHLFTTEFVAFNTKFQGCVDQMQKYANGDNFFEYNTTWKVDDFIKKTGISDIRNGDDIEYNIISIFWPYVLLSVYSESEWWGYILAIEKTENWWEKFWEWQDIDYNSCMEIKQMDPSIWEWSIFQECPNTICQE